MYIYDEAVPELQWREKEWERAVNDELTWIRLRGTLALEKP